MPTFVLVYRMPVGYVPGGPEAMVAWTAWLDSLGQGLSDRGNPVFESAGLGSRGEETRLGGYSFTAEDMASAVGAGQGIPGFARRRRRRGRRRHGAQPRIALERPRLSRWRPRQPARTTGYQRNRPPGNGQWKEAIVTDTEQFSATPAEASADYQKTIRVKATPGPCSTR